MESVFTTLIAENTLRSNITGLIVNASVAPGVAPAACVACVYQPVGVEDASRVPTDVVFDPISPRTVVVPGTTIDCCSPRTVADDAVNGVAVAVKVVAVAAVNGVPVVEDSAAWLWSPHSVTASVVVKLTVATVL